MGRDVLAHIHKTDTSKSAGRASLPPLFLRRAKPLGNRTGRFSRSILRALRKALRRAPPLCSRAPLVGMTPSKTKRVTPSSSIYEVGTPTLAPLPALAESDRGSDWMEDYDGLFVTARLNVLQGTLLTSVAAINKGAEIPYEVNADWTYPLRATLDDLPVLQAKEVGTCFQKTCCPLTRGWHMDFRDPDSAVYFGMNRPAVLEPLCCWPVVFMRSQHLSMGDKHGKLLARAFEPVGCFQSCWTRTYVVLDQEHNHILTLKASECGTQTGCNFCAPTIFNESYDVEVYSPEGQYLNSSSFVYPGMSCGRINDRSNLLVRFPKGLNGAGRAGLFGGLMLVEYTAMEMIRLRSFSSSATGTSFGKPVPGGAPDSCEMQR
jgi:hypothetical protein